MRRGSVILTAVANLPQQALVDLCQGKHRERLINDFRCGPIRVGKSGKGNGTLSRVFNRFKGLVRVPRLLRGANRSRMARTPLHASTHHSAPLFPQVRTDPDTSAASPLAGRCGAIGAPGRRRP